jgi:hypothetical protein
MAKKPRASAITKLAMMPISARLGPRFPAHLGSEMRERTRLRSSFQLRHGGDHGAAADWQEALRLGAEEERQTSLDELAALIDWPQADQVMASLYPPAKGEKAWPPWRCSGRSLLATWHDLSDAALSETSPAGQASAAFAALPATRRRPSAPPSCASAACLLHTASIAAFAAIARILESKALLCAMARLSMRPSSARPSKAIKRQPGVKHRTRVPAHGYKAHNTTTPANEPDVSIAPSIIPDQPREVYADNL